VWLLVLESGGQDNSAVKHCWWRVRNKR